MKILLVSMQSIHVTRWTQQLEHAGHEVYWFNIRGGERNSQLPWVKQYTDWHQRFPNIKGRYMLKKLGKKIRPLGIFLERDVESAFAKAIQEIQPDIVHSFALYVACTPILEVMKRNQIKFLLQRRCKTSSRYKRSIAASKLYVF